MKSKTLQFSPAKDSSHLSEYLSQFISRGESDSFILSKLTFIISNVQILLILVWGQLSYLDPQVRDSFTMFIDEFSNVGIYQILLKEYASQGTLHTILIFFGLYAILLTIFMAYGLKQSTVTCTTTLRRYSWITKSSYLHLKVVYFFMNIILLKLIKITTQYHNSNPAILMISIILLIWNNLFGLIGAILTFDPFFSDNNFACRNSSLQFLVFLTKVIITPILVLVEFQSKWIQISIICFLIGMARILILAKKLPYYHFQGTMWSLSSSVLCTGASVFLFLSGIIFYSKSALTLNLIYCEVLILPFLLKIPLSVLRKRLRIALEYRTRLPKSETEVFEQCMLIHHIFNSSGQDFHGNTENAVYLIDLVSEHENTCSNRTCICKHLVKKTTSLIESHHTLSALGTILITEILQNASRTLKHCDDILTALAYYQFSKHKSEKGALLTLGNLTEASLLRKIIIHKLKQEIQVMNLTKYESNSNVLDVKNFVDYHTQLSLILQKLSETTAKHISFWKLFEKNDYSLDSILSMNQEIEKYVLQLDKLWSQFDAEYFNSYDQYPKYAFYLATVKNAPNSAEKLMREFKKKFLLNVSDPCVSGFTNRTLQDRDNIIVSFSMDKTSCGIIKDISATVSELGWESKEIKNCHISTILPNFINESILDLTRNFLEIEQELKFMDRSFPCFLKNQEGYIIPYYGYISLNPYISKNISYIAVFKKRKTNSEFILLTGNDEIDSVTPLLAKTLNLATNKRVSISEICQNYHEPSKLTPIKIISEGLSPARHSPNNKDDEKVLTFKTFDLNTQKYVENEYISESSQIKIGSQIITVLELTGLKTHEDSSEKREKVKPVEFCVTESSDPMVSIHSSGDFGIEKNMANRNISYKILKNSTRDSKAFSQSIDNNNVVKVSSFLSPNFNYHSSVGDLIKALRIGPKHDQAMVKIEITEDSDDDTKHGHPEKVISYEFSKTKQEEKSGEKWKLTTSVQSSTKSNKYKALEDTVHTLPRQRSALLLNLVALVVFISCCSMLVYFFFLAKEHFDNIKVDIATMEQSTQLMARVIQNYKFAKQYMMFEDGLFEPDRYETNWYGNAMRRFTRSVATSLGEKAEVFQQSMDSLTHTLKQKMFEKSIPMHDLYDETIFYNVNVFEITRKLVLAGQAYPMSTISLNNTDLRFVVNNSLNEYLLKLEAISTELLHDCHDQFALIFKKNIQSICLALMLGAILLGLYVWRERAFLKQKDHLLNLLAIVDSKPIQRHIELLQDSHSLLSQNTHKEARLFKSYQAVFEETLKSDGKPGTLNMKRLLTMKGVQRSSLKNFLTLVLFLLTLLSAFVALQLMFVTSGKQAEILDYVEREYETSLGYYRIRLLFMSTYSYVQENKTSLLRTYPIEQEWERLYQQSVDFQAYLADLVQYYSNKSVEALIRGDLCVQENIVANPRSCRTKMDGVTSQGIIGINSYLLSSAKAVRDIFDSSPREKEDMIYALNYSQFIKVENNDNTYFVGGYESLIEALILETNDKVDDAGDLILVVIVAFLVCDSLLGLVLWRKMYLTMINERINWSKLLRRIPFTVLMTSKILKSYLNRTNQNLFD